jgi:hypothetical protein
MMEHKNDLAALPHTESHCPIPPPQSNDILGPILPLQLQSPKISLEKGNFNPPPQAQPATETKARGQVVLIDDNGAAAPRNGNDSTIVEPAMSLPIQINGKDEGEAENEEEELHNNNNAQQHQQQQEQKQEEAEPTTTINTAAQNNNNPTALSTAAAGASLPPTSSLGGAEHGNEEDDHEDGHRPKLHHLTRHWLPPEDRGTSAIEHMGASSVKEAEQKIRGMSQKELRASFQKVYGTPTSSFNNNWLRRKLYEAVGANGTASTKRYRRVGRNDAAARKRELQRVAAAEAEAEAVEALAEIAAGPSMGGNEVPAESSST